MKKVYESPCVSVHTWEQPEIIVTSINRDPERDGDEESDDYLG